MQKRRQHALFCSGIKCSLNSAVLWFGALYQERECAFKCKWYTLVAIFVVLECIISLLWVRELVVVLL